MSTLMQASHQWMSRPADERFTSLLDMQDHFDRIREQSRATVVASRRIFARPEEDNKGLVVAAGSETFEPTHWAFGQLAARVSAPAGYLRTLPSPIAADCINYGLQYSRDVEDVGILLYNNGAATLRAVTGPNYGRIWNAEIVAHLIARFGDGVTGTWRVPGEFGKRINVNKDNTTLYAGDRDMFVFLCDEDNRIEIGDTRGTTLARGFFVWNSEVGSETYGIATFLFDYVCCNRMVWGAQEFKQISVRHTKSAPDRFLEETRPALEAYARGSANSVVQAVENAKKARLSGEDGQLDEFLKSRFTNRLVGVIKSTFEAEEGRPIENMWDVATGVTAYAKTITWQDQRVDLERKAGAILQAASK